MHKSTINADITPQTYQQRKTVYQIQLPELKKNSQQPHLGISILLN